MFANILSSLVSKNENGCRRGIYVRGTKREEQIKKRFAYRIQVAKIQVFLSVRGLQDKKAIRDAPSETKERVK